METRIFLIGMMGAGKTTLGKILAEELDYIFVDLDEEIEKQQQMLISDIFNKKGEAAFRRLENEALQQILKQEKIVCAAGGGIVLSEINRKLLKDKAEIIYLTASAQTLEKRLTNVSNRPLLHPKNIKHQLQQLQKQREALYQSIADYQCVTDCLTPNECVEEMILYAKHH